MGHNQLELREKNVGMNFNVDTLNLLNLQDVEYVDLQDLLEIFSKRESKTSNRW